MTFKIPKDYRPQLASETMEQAIKMLKAVFQEELSRQLNLRRVTAPLFVLAGTGINDDLNGVERPVSFPVRFMGDRRAEVIHSLAKWKRMKLGTYGIPPNYGLYTDMNAIRSDEDLDNLHSIYVDQWDWEQTISAEDRNLDFLKTTVRKIYEAIKSMEHKVYEQYSHIYPVLPKEITFLHAEDLQKEYPHLTPRERENIAVKKHKAIFIIGIGGPLPDGQIHDGRAPDYDDWTTPTTDGHRGLNGDIIFWNHVINSGTEISSMGIRVDRDVLLNQLRIRDCEERINLAFHKALLEGAYPLSVGGGIGQSRLCMFLLRAAHIGEVQSSVWPEEMIETCRKHNIYLK
ncbi:MAG: aspartate--ammonia ligase [Bacteroidales bacterium]|nr:aspartate--ammonia ligase [Bacteroidales bacterium]